jgi:hypothetical protein
VRGDKTRRRELLGMLGGGLWKGGMEENDIHEEQSFEENTFYIFLVVFLWTKIKEVHEASGRN